MLNSNNPNTNKIIGYVILFIGFVFFAVGWRIKNTVGIGRLFGYVLIIIGLALCVAATVWVVKKVRCPHCNALLSLKMKSEHICPYCHEKIDN